MQKKLDDTYQNKGFFDNEFVDQKRILALLVEIGEFANEYEPFKYWKKQSNFNKKLVLEEFVDGIHFFASIINKTNTNVQNVNSKIASNDKSIQLLHTFNAIINIFKKASSENVLEAFSLYLGNAELLNIKFNEIQEAYIEKNKVNFERIKNGY